MMGFHLQKSWTYEPSLDGVIILSTLRRLKYLLRGEVQPISQFLSALVEGVSSEDDAKEKARCAGLRPKDADRLITHLMGCGALVRTRPVSAEASATWARQSLFFDFFETDEQSGADIQTRLAQARVLVVGVGGYGTWLAALLARVGIGTIILIDPDTIEQSNLNRQILFSYGDIGRSKVELAAEKLAEIDPNVKIEVHQTAVRTRDELEKHLENVDFVFNAFGYGNGRLVSLLDSTCQIAKVPLLTFSGSWIGPLSVAGRSASLASAKKVIQTIDGADNLVRNQDSPTRSSHIPSFAPRIALSASLAVWEAVRFLGGIDEPPTMRGIVVLDLFNYKRHGFIPISL